MNGPIACFLLERAGLTAVGLRRYASSGGPGRPCPGRLGYHSATVYLADLPDDEARIRRDHPPPADDPRWPTACECGYVFGPDDQRHVWTEHLYRRADGASPELHSVHPSTPRAAPAGAIWRADWLEPAHRGPDGRAYMVRLPVGDWCPDMPSTDGKAWTRTGEAPRFTCSPSVWMDKPRGWHGHLRDGVLVPV